MALFQTERVNKKLVTMKLGSCVRRIPVVATQDKHSA